MRATSSGGTTFAGYELCLRRAVSRLGSVPIARLTPQLIQACYAGLLAEGLSPRTVFHTHVVLHRALKRARNWGLTTAIPTELVSVPRLPYREMQALSKAQLEVLLETSRETRWYPLWVLLGTTGPHLAIVALEQHRLRVRGEFVFPNRDGDPTESSTVTDALKVALDRAGLPRIRVHDLRHTTATVLLEAGVHPKLVHHRRQGSRQ